METAPPFTKSLTHSLVLYLSLGAAKRIITKAILVLGLKLRFPGLSQPGILDSHTREFCMKDRSLTKTVLVLELKL